MRFTSLTCHPAGSADAIHHHATFLEAYRACRRAMRMGAEYAEITSYGTACLWTVWEA